MKLKLPQFIRKALLAALVSSCAFSTSYAGFMLDEIGYDVYRNFAENRDGYEAGAQNVPIYNKDGVQIGTVPIMPDFSAATDSVGAAAGLAGGQSWIIDCAHNGPISSVTFGIRQGTVGTAVHESYRVVGGSEFGLDIGTFRLNKVATDAVHYELTRDDKYTQDSAIFNSENLNIWRVGTGTQITYTAEGVAQWEDGGYANITAGSYSFSWMYWATRSASNGRGETLDITGTVRASKPIVAEGETHQIPILGNSGDSGSPVIFFNPDTQSFQFIGTTYAMGGEGAKNNISYTSYSLDFYDFIIDGSAQFFNPLATTWTVGASDDQGIVSLTSELGEGTIRTLKQGERGVTSTVGTAATDSEMWAALDWVLSSDNSTLNFTGSLDTGAGTMQFRRGLLTSADNPAMYDLIAASSDVNINTAGYIIQEHVYVRSNLTGKDGDEWRIVGENARLDAVTGYGTYGGFFELAGTGNNDADLNLGVGVTVLLNREGGYAAQDVQINTGARVIMGDANQIAGSLNYGLDGGTIDLNGNSWSRNSDNLYTFDKNAEIVNFAEGSNINFTYTAQGEQESFVKAAFYDTTSILENGTSVMNINIDEATGHQSAVTFSNNILIAGDMDINGADVTLTGYQVEIANPDVNSSNSNYQPLLHPDKWVNVVMDVENISVGGGSKLNLGQHVTVVANQLTMAAGTQFNMSQNAQFIGNLDIHGQASLDNGSNISGVVGIHSGAQLNMLGGGDFNFDLNLHQGSSMQTDSLLTMRGQITNAGDMHIAGNIQLAQGIINSGTISFDAESFINIALMSPEMIQGTTIYQIFTGGESSSFDALTSSNIIGAGAESHVWEFYSDGRAAIVALDEKTFRGGALNLAHGATGFENGAQFENGVSSILFTNGSSTVTLNQADLSVKRIAVDGGSSLNLVSNGNTLTVDRMLLREDAQLRITGEALSAQTRVSQEGGSRDVSVTLDMEGTTISGKSWLVHYTGNVALTDGTYDVGQNETLFNSLHLEESGTILLRDTENFAINTSGNGTINLQHEGSVSLSNIENFSGRITSSANSISLLGSTGASLHLQEQSALHVGGNSVLTGSISGNGSINVKSEGVTRLEDISAFTGTLNLQSKHLQINGDTTLQKITIGNNSTLELLAGTQITSLSTDTMRFQNYNLILSDGAQLNESGRQLHFAGGTMNVSGTGLYTVKGFSLSAGNSKGVLNVLEGSTMHIVGTKHYADNWGSASFQLSTWSQHNIINVAGTLISEAGISNLDGYGTINILDGGTLELREGLRFNSQSNRASYINVESGGTLVVGQQYDNTDFGNSANAKRLEVTMTDGATLAAVGSGAISTPHSFVWEEGSSYSVRANAGQDFSLLQKVNGTHLNIIGAGRVRLHGVQADTLQVHAGSTLSMASDNNALNRLTLDGTLAVDSAHHVNYNIHGTGNINIDNTSLSIASDIAGFTGNITLTGANSLLDLTAGANINAHIIQEAGTINLGSVLSISQAISSAGASINFADDTIINIPTTSGLSEDGILSFTIFTGTSSESFAALNGDNVSGGYAADYNWTFDSSGTLTGSLIGGLLNLSSGNVMLQVGATGFDGAASYSNGSTMRVRAGESSITLNESNLSMRRIQIEGASLNLYSNGYQLDVNNVVLEQGSNLLIHGNAFTSHSRIINVEGASETNVTVNMAGGELSAASDWFANYSGNLNLQNGTFTMDVKNMENVDFNIDANTTLNILDVATIGTNLRGEGIINSTATESLVCADLTQFNGTLYTVANELHLQSNTAAGIVLASNTTAQIQAGSSYSGAISGQGVLNVNGDGTTRISNLSNFQGAINVNSGVIALGGVSHQIAALNFTDDMRIDVLDNAQLHSLAAGTRFATDYTINLGANSELREAGIHLKPVDGELTITGSGLYEVGGLTLSSENKQVDVHIMGDATLYISGTNDQQTGGGGGSFQISTWPHRNTINIEGALISEAGISSRDGNADINIMNGGLLELKKGPIFNYNLSKVSTIQVQDGGTLLLGNQSNTTDYGSRSRAGRLEVHMHSGSTLGASGTDDLTIYHTLITEDNADVSFVTKTDQDINVVSALGSMHAHAVGDGSLTVQNTGAARNFSVSAKALNFTQQNVQLDSLQVQGANSKVNFAANTESVQIGSTTIANNGGLSIERNGAQQGSMVQNEFRNVTIKNAALVGTQNVSLANVSLTNTRIAQSQFQVNDGQSLVSNSVMEEDARFILQADGQLRVENTQITHYDSNTFTLVNGVDANLKDKITLSNTSVSLDSSLQRFESGTALFDMFTVKGFNSLASEVTIDNFLYINVEGIDFANLYSDNPYYLYVNFENQYFAKDDAIIDQLILKSGDYQIALGDAHHLGGSFTFNSTMYNSVQSVAFSSPSAASQFALVPEPSTATLSLLALSGLLLRRRRKQA